MLEKIAHPMRFFLLLLAIVLVVHGFLGPQFAPKNLTTLFIWVHYRGLLVLTVLFLGNVFCASCPLVLLRNMGRHFVKPTLYWPSPLRNKWLSIFLFIAILFAYERYRLWSSPFLTAWVVVGYFALILVIDLLFKEASFCKYVCPLGQFNFLAALMAPAQVGAKDLSICAACTTHDCLRGAKGCELKLFIPQKVGNLDCTFCLDCKRACPHDNIAIIPQVPGSSLADDEARSGLGRAWLRVDFAALTVVFVFGALLNAFLMVGPAFRLEGWLGEMLHHKSESLAITELFFIFLLLAPAFFFLLCSSFSKIGSGLSRIAIIFRFIPSLVPVGLSIWLAHYSFHFFTGVFTFLPVLVSYFYTPSIEFWARFPLGLSKGLVVPMQMGMLLLGFIGSVLAAKTIAGKWQPRRSFRLALPWYILFLFICFFSAWIFSLPMEMRGTVIG